MASTTTYRENAVNKAMTVLKRASGPLTRAEINDRCGEIAGATDKSHKVAGEVNDAEFAGRIVKGHFFTRPGRGLYSCAKAPEGLENAADLAAEIRANSKKVSEETAEENGDSTEAETTDES